jgi:broad specificity phosphatase PhoE
MHKPSTRFLFIRHGQTDWNVERRWQGQIDTFLNEKGRSQAEQVAELLASKQKVVKTIYCSDLQRAFHTAQIIGQRLQCDVLKDSRLREMHLGDAQGLLWHEVEERFNLLQSGFRDIPRAETVEQLLERMQSFLTEIAAKHKNQTVIVVSHKAAIKSLILQGGGHEDPENCSITEFEYDGSLSFPLIFANLHNFETC